MPTPYVSGTSSIPARWLHGSASVLWIGDSIGAALQNRLFQVLRVTPAGYAFAGATFNSIAAPAWAAVGAGGLGAAGLLTENSYSPFASVEAVFNGTAVPVTGAPATVNSRLIAEDYEPLLTGGRTALFLGGADWLLSPGMNLRYIVYRNPTSSNGVVRHFVRGSASSGIPKGVGAFLDLQSVTPAYAADDVPFAPAIVGEEIYLGAQSFESAAPVNGSNYVLCCGLLSVARPGFTFIPASHSGWDVLKWLDTTAISNAALAGVLPLLGITDIVISIGKDNPTSQTAAQFQASLQHLVARFRAVLPAAAVTFLPTYDTNNAGSAPHLAGFADAHYAVQQLTDNSCFLNLYRAAGPWAQNNGFNLFADGVNPNDAGKLYFLQTIQSLLDILLGGDRATAAGRYAAQADIEDLFGRANVTAWSEIDGSGVVDVPRVQRALDAADATIDDFFRDGPYAVPLLAIASASTLTAWAATLAGVTLYRSRTADAVDGGVSPLTASVSIAGTSVSASVGQTADPYAALVATVRSQMARCKADGFRLDARAAVPSNAPSLVR